jgi:hypothetical protein
VLGTVKFLSDHRFLAGVTGHPRDKNVGEKGRERAGALAVESG